MQKKQINQVEFNKRVDMEFAYLTYVDRMPKKEANSEANKYVKNKFEVVEKSRH